MRDREGVDLSGKGGWMEPGGVEGGEDHNQMCSTEEKSIFSKRGGGTAASKRLNPI